MSEINRNVHIKTYITQKNEILNYILASNECLKRQKIYRYIQAIWNIIRVLPVPQLRNERVNLTRTHIHEPSVYPRFHPFLPGRDLPALPR